MQFRPTLLALAGRGVVVTASLFLLGVAGVTQPTVELIAPSTVRTGDTVEIVLRLRNDGERPIDVELSGRPVGFDIVIAGQGGNEVWRRLRHGTVGAALMLLTLKPGEARDFTERWPQQDNQGRPIAPGRYTIEGILPMGERQPITDSRTLIIEP